MNIFSISRREKVALERIVPYPITTHTSHTTPKSKKTLTQPIKVASPSPTRTHELKSDRHTATTATAGIPWCRKHKRKENHPIPQTQPSQPAADLPDRGAGALQEGPPNRIQRIRVAKHTIHVPTCTCIVTCPAICIHVYTYPHTYIYAKGRYVCT